MSNAKGGEARVRIFYNGFSVLALLAFLAAFIGARVFTTLYPNTVEVSGGIHFHHFWYGLAMIVVAGWLGIASTNPRYRPILAVIFGFGGGLVADELGLLLTFGNYHSPLTYPVVVGIIVIAVLIILFLHSGEDLRRDLERISFGEKVALLGVCISGLSVLAFARNNFAFAIGILVFGCIVIAAGIWLEKKE